MTVEQFKKIQEMTSDDVYDLMVAMWSNDHCCVDTGEPIDSEMWNLAQMLDDNFNLDDADDAKIAKDYLIEFFVGISYNNNSKEEYDHFVAYTEGFLEDYFEGNLTKVTPITDEEEGHFLQIPEEYLQDGKPGVSIEMYMENN